MAGTVRWGGPRQPSPSRMQAALTTPHPPQGSRLHRSRMSRTLLSQFPAVKWSHSVVMRIRGPCHTRSLCQVPIGFQAHSCHGALCSAGGFRVLLDYPDVPGH